MKNIILFTIALFLLWACSSSKKAVDITRSLQTQTSLQEKMNTSFGFRIDSTRSSEYEMTYTKIEFYDPARNGREFKTSSDDEEEALTEEESVPVELQEDKPPNVGPVKSIEQWTIKSKDEKKGESEASESFNFENDQSVNEQEEVAAKSEETPVPDPMRWRYIFYLALLGVAVFLYLKRKPFFKRLKTFFAKE